MPNHCDISSPQLDNFSLVTFTNWSWVKTKVFLECFVESLSQFFM